MCQSGAKPRSEIQLSATEIQTYPYLLTPNIRAKQSNHVLKVILHQQSPSPEAAAIGCKWNKTLEMSQSELKGKLSAGSAPEHLMQFSHTLGKMLMLQFIELDKQVIHPKNILFFSASVKMDL